MFGVGQYGSGTFFGRSPKVGAKRYTFTGRTFMFWCPGVTGACLKWIIVGFWPEMGPVGHLGLPACVYEIFEVGLAKNRVLYLYTFVGRI
jgi:hypothetical protein